MTVRYPEEVLVLPEGYRGMISYNKKLCISCGMCARICPADAMKMYPGPEEGGRRKMYPGINYARCIFCGFCVDVCPTGALEHTDVHDMAFESFEAQIMTPEEFERGPPRPEFRRPPRRLKPVMDERRGIRYEPVD